MGFNPLYWLTGRLGRWAISGNMNAMFFLRSLMVVAVLLLPVTAGVAGGSKPVMTFRIHIELKEDTGGGGAVIPIALSNPTQTITVNRSPKLSEMHLRSVTPTPDGGMMVQTTTTGTGLLEEATRSNPGRIMVVLLNGQVVYAPVIDIPLTSGRLLIPGPIPPEIVAALQTQITQARKK